MLVVEIALLALELIAAIVLLAIYSVRYRKVVWALMLLAMVPFIFSTEAFFAIGLFFICLVARIVAGDFGKKQAARGDVVKASVLVYTSAIAVLLTSISAAEFLYGSVVPDALSALYDFLPIIIVVAYFSFFLARHNRTFIEDLANIVVSGRDGNYLSFSRALARYLIMLATFPLGFGLINFVFPEPLYNKWTGAVEYRNEVQCIKYGWLYRSVKRLFAREETATTGDA